MQDWRRGGEVVAGEEKRRATELGSGIYIAAGIKS